MTKFSNKNNFSPSGNITSLQTEDGNFAIGTTISFRESDGKIKQTTLINIDNYGEMLVSDTEGNTFYLTEEQRHSHKKLTLSSRKKTARRSIQSVLRGLENENPELIVGTLVSWKDSSGQTHSGEVISSTKKKEDVQVKIEGSEKTEFINKSDLLILPQSLKNVRKKIGNWKEKMISEAAQEQAETALSNPILQHIESENRRGFLKALTAAFTASAMAFLGKKALSYNDDEEGTDKTSNHDLHNEHHEGFLESLRGWGKIVNAMLSMPLFVKYLAEVIQDGKASSESNLNALFAMGGNFITEGLEHGFEAKMKHAGMDHVMFAVVFMGAMGGDKYGKIAKKMGWNNGTHFEKIEASNAKESLKEFNDALWGNVFINMFSSGAAGIENNKICLNYADAYIYRDSISSMDTLRNTTLSFIENTPKDKQPEDIIDLATFEEWSDEYEKTKDLFKSSLDKSKIAASISNLKKSFHDKFDANERNHGEKELLQQISKELNTFEETILNDEKWEVMGQMTQHARMLSNVLGGMVVGDPPNLLMLIQLIDGRMSVGGFLKAQFRVVAEGTAAEYIHYKKNIGPNLEKSLGIENPTTNAEVIKGVYDDMKSGLGSLVNVGGKLKDSASLRRSVKGVETVATQIGTDIQKIYTEIKKSVFDNQELEKSILFDIQGLSLEEQKEYLQSIHLEDLATLEERESKTSYSEKKKFLKAISESSVENIANMVEKISTDLGIEKKAVFELLEKIHIKVSDEGYDETLKDKRLWNDFNTLLGNVVIASRFLLASSYLDEKSEQEQGSQEKIPLSEEKIIEKVLKKYSLRTDKASQTFEEFSHDVLPIIEDIVGHGAKEVAEIVLPQMWFVMGMLPGISGAVQMKIAGMGLKEGEKLTDKQFQSINGVIAGILAPMSAVADNLAMYMISVGVYDDLIKRNLITQDQYEEGCNNAYINDIIWGPASHFGGPASVVFSDGKENPIKNGIGPILLSTLPQYYKSLGIPTSLIFMAALIFYPEIYEKINSAYNKYLKAKEAGDEERAADILNDISTWIKEIATNFTHKKEVQRIAELDDKIAQSNDENEKEELRKEQDELNLQLKLSMQKGLLSLSQDVFMEVFPEKSRKKIEKVLTVAENARKNVTKRWKKEGEERRKDIDDKFDENLGAYIKQYENEYKKSEEVTSA
jgi:hypothetical protein